MNNLSTEESEGYTQFLQALGIELDITMDQDHKDFEEDKQEEKKRKKILSAQSPHGN